MDSTPSRFVARSGTTRTIARQVAAEGKPSFLALACLKATESGGTNLDPLVTTCNLRKSGVAGARCQLRLLLDACTRLAI